MSVRLIKKSWWVDFRFNDTRYRKRSPGNSRAGAIAHEAVLRHRLVQGLTLDGSSNSTPDNPSFADFAGKWFEEYVVPNNKYSEQRAKRYILSGSLIPFFGNLRIDQITTRHVEQFKASQMKGGVGNKTINNRLAVLGKYLVTAHEWLNMESRAPRIRMLKCAPPQTTYLTTEECDQLLAHAEGVVYELILTALRTGMRQGELRGLQWEVINWQSQTLIVRHSRCDLLKVLQSTKSNRERHIPLDMEVYQSLLRRKRLSGYVFQDLDHAPFDDKRLRRRLAAVCKRAGVRRVTWHAFRHTFASNLAMRGVPLNTVQALLGHSSITTTMRYSHVAPSSLRLAIDLLASRLSPAFGQPAVNQWSEMQRMEAA